MVDVDGAVGADRLRDLQRIHGVLGAPLWQRSGRLKEGWHLVYRMPDGQRVSVGKLGPHLDVKYRGYIVVAPSLHSSGLRYRWATSDPPGYPPSWLCRLLDPPPSQPRLKRPSFTSPAKPGAARRVLELRAADIAAVPEHGGDTRYLGRHDALRRGATYLGGLVAKGSLDEGEVIDALLAACRDNGYLDEVGERLVYRTIIDGLTHAGVNR